ncbi:MAG: hypothetical protein ABSE63_17415 [Thermoguttaceae bacterium]|jgi:hypothetical protein
MNENTHKALMIEVERAVRPVRASQARKLRMREELLAHLTAVFEEETTRSSDERSALDQAKQRFGDPRELAHELQQSVPISSRIYYLLEITGFRMMSDSPLIFVAKGLLFSISIIAITAPLLLIALNYQGKTAEFGMREIIVVKMLAIIMGSMMLGVVFLSRLYRTFFAEGSRPFGARAAIDILMSLCAFPLLAFTNYIVLTGDLTASLAQTRFACIFIPAAPVIFLLLVRQHALEIRAQEKWSKLEIDAWN